MMIDDVDLNLLSTCLVIHTSIKILSTNIFIRQLVYSNQKDTRGTASEGQ